MLKQQRSTPLNERNLPRLEEAMQQAFGPQQITLNGVPENSHLARVLVAADYRMKRLAMKLDESPIRGFPSYRRPGQEIRSASCRTTNPRWWLAATTNRSPKARDGLAWELRGRGVKCLTENDIIAADGSAQPTGKTSTVAQQWADLMTDKYEQLAAQEPVFGELRNVMDLCVVAAVIDQHELAAQAGCDLRC